MFTNISLGPEVVEKLHQTANTLRDDLLALLRQHAESGPPEILPFLIATAVAAGFQADAVDVLTDVAKQHGGQLCPNHDQGEVGAAVYRAAQWISLIVLRSRPDLQLQKVEGEES
jgi:hypothetical protein